MHCLPQAIKNAISSVTGGPISHDVFPDSDQTTLKSHPMAGKPISNYADAPSGALLEESGTTEAQIAGELPESLVGRYDERPVMGLNSSYGVTNPVSDDRRGFGTTGPDVGVVGGDGMGQDQLKQEREWDRVPSKQVGLQVVSWSLHL